MGVRNTNAKAKDLPTPAKYRVAQKQGHPISLQIFWKLHDRIAWKLVNISNINAEHSH